MPARTAAGSRVVGTGHSSSPLLRTDGVLASLENLQGPIVVDDPQAQEATVGAGMTLRDAGSAFLANGMGPSTTQGTWTSRA